MTMPNPINDVQRISDRSRRELFLANKRLFSLDAVYKAGAAQAPSLFPTDQIINKVLHT